MVPLWDDEEMSSPEAVSSGSAPEGKLPESYWDYVPPLDVTGEVFGLSDAAVLTPAIAGTDVPAIAGMEFPAVAEDLSLADDARGSPSVIRVSEPLRAVVRAVPLINVGKASSVVLRRPMGL